MTKEQLKDRCKQAAKLGCEEANKGGSVVPALCAPLQPLFKGCEPGQAIKIMEAFQQAYIDQPVNFE